MRAALYTRVSSEEQASGGHSLTTQEDLCRRYAATSGLEVVTAYSDSLSGANIERPGLQAMLLACEAGEIQAVIVHANDRLTRDRMHLGLILERLLNAGTALHFVVSGPYDFESDEARMMLGLLGEFASYWRSKIRMNARLGKRRRAERGKISLSAVPPYGYAFNDARDNLIIIEEQAAVVRQVFDWYVNAGSALSLSAVARRLAGTPSPSDTGHAPPGFASARKAGEGVWSKSMIRKILGNPTYAGSWVYGAARVRYDGKVVKNGDTVVVPVPQIVTEALQAKALERLKENRGRRDARAKRPYLLAGHVFCGLCGKRYSGMAVTSGTVEYTYVRCNGRTRTDEGRCINHTIPAPWLEKQARMFLIAITSNSEYRGLLEAERDARRTAADPVPERIAKLDARLTSLRNKRVALLNALDGAGSGESGKAIGRKLAGLDEDEARLKSERRELEAAPRIVRFDQGKLHAWAKRLVNDEATTTGEYWNMAALLIDWANDATPGTREGLEALAPPKKATPAEIAAANARAFESIRRLMREVQFSATVLADETVDFRAKVPGSSTDVHSSVLAFLTLKREG